MNGIMMQTFQWDLPADGTLWQTLAKKARTLSLLGVTAAWLPPAYKGSAGGMDVGYGVYDLYDLGEFDQKGSVRTKYGTKAEYLKAVRRMNLAGIQTLGDVVLNHRLGADGTETAPVTPVNPEYRPEKLGDKRPGTVYTRFTFPGRKGKYSNFVWNASCFTAVDYNQDDPDHHLFLLGDSQWAEDVDDEKGNYDYLMGADVNVLSPAVSAELLRWGLWYLKTTGLGGFRLDAVKHISASFLRDFLHEMRAKTGREVYAVGEYWSADTEKLMRYLDTTGYAMNLFDAPLHFHFHAASRSGGSYDMRHLLEGTLLERAPSQAVTFVDNHDTQPGQSLESWVDGWFKASAYCAILLRAQGYPCVFWGDLYGIPEKGIGAVSELPRLMQIRLFQAYGEEQDYFDDPQTIGFTRSGDPAIPGSGLACLITDGEGGEKRMLVGKRFASQRFICAIGGQKPVRIDSEGYGVFRVSGGKCSVYTPAPDLKSVLYRLGTQAKRLFRLQLG
ncbi:MAG: alpha-amylase [Clostridia bacterium]|nr:alpha-amylase [Clostridia bacterium]